MKQPDTSLLRLIGAFKLLKAATLIAIGIGVFKLVHADIGAVLERWAILLSLDPDGRLVTHLMERVTNIPPHRFRQLGIASFVYAALFATEGVGLLLLKRWAEWFTVIITSSLVPIEMYEIFRRPTAIKVLVLLINVAVVVYLVHHVTRQASAKPHTNPLRTE